MILRFLGGARRKEEVSHERVMNGSYLLVVTNSPDSPSPVDPSRRRCLLLLLWFSCSSSAVVVEAEEDDDEDDEDESKVADAGLL